MANGKIRDLPRRRDRCLKIRDRDLHDFRKSEPETLCRENRARDLNYAKLRARDVRFVRSWSLETSVLVDITSYGRGEGGGQETAKTQM